jgi:hypothetical protein
MTGFSAPVASAAWILARAAGHIPSATTATVLFGSRVHALTWPGQVPARVTDFDATDSTERFCRALDALDGGQCCTRPRAGQPGAGGPAGRKGEERENPSVKGRQVTRVGAGKPEL